MLGVYARDNRRVSRGRRAVQWYTRTNQQSTVPVSPASLSCTRSVHVPCWFLPFSTLRGCSGWNCPAYGTRPTPIGVDAVSVNVVYTVFVPHGFGPVPKLSPPPP